MIYNGVHYDALAIAASPRADQDDDVTEFNPRTRRGKVILAAAQQLVSQLEWDADVLATLSLSCGCLCMLYASLIGRFQWAGSVCGEGSIKSKMNGSGISPRETPNGRSCRCVNSKP